MVSPEIAGGTGGYFAPPVDTPMLHSKYVSRLIGTSLLKAQVHNCTDYKIILFMYNKLL